MKGNKEVVDYLNSLIAGELMARDQYFLHANIFDEWGFAKLAEHYNHEMEEEKVHAESLIRRVLFLEAIPNMKPLELRIGSDIISILKSDLELEYEVRDNLKKGIVICEKNHDFVSRDLLLVQLKDTEEDHAYWLEQQLSIIEQIGLQNYMQSMK